MQKLPETLEKWRNLEKPSEKKKGPGEEGVRFLFSTEPKPRPGGKISNGAVCPPRMVESVAEKCKADRQSPLEKNKKRGRGGGRKKPIKVCFSRPSWGPVPLPCHSFPPRGHCRVLFPTYKVSAARYDARTWLGSVGVMCELIFVLCSTCKGGFSCQ